MSIQEEALKSAISSFLDKVAPQFRDDPDFINLSLRVGRTGPGLPVLKRFKAIYRGEPIVGVKIENEPGNLKFVNWYWDCDEQSFQTDWNSEADLKDIEFLDN